MSPIRRAKNNNSAKPEAAEQHDSLPQVGDDYNYCVNVDSYLQELRQKFPWREYLYKRV